MNCYTREERDYLNGQRDCREGKPCANNGTEDYYAGWSAQYEWEQIKTELNIKQETIH